MTAQPHGAEFGMAMPTGIFVAIPAGRTPNAKSEAQQKPWLAAGISQRTYYRRKAAAAALAPVQHNAHVAAWLAAASIDARLDYRGLIRRCARTARDHQTPVFDLYVSALRGS